jgi:hypothetical protein
MLDGREVRMLWIFSLCSLLFALVNSFLGKVLLRSLIAGFLALSITLALRMERHF